MLVTERPICEMKSPADLCRNSIKVRDVYTNSNCSSQISLPFTIKYFRILSKPEYLLAKTLSLLLADVKI